MDSKKSAVEQTSTTSMKFQLSAEDDLTEEQMEEFNKLKSLVADDLQPEFDDQRLLKFLIARKFDVESAATMVKKHLEYWKKTELVRFLKDYQEPEKSKYFATTPLGYDKEGALVRLLRVGISDLRGLAMSHTKLEAVMMAAYLLETDKFNQKKSYAETGAGGDDKQAYIIDLEGLSWRVIFFRPLVQMFVLMLRLYEANYPESLKTAYIVNVPHFFTMIFNFVKKILPVEIIDKVEILSAEQCGPTLTSTMDPAILPKFLGGTRTDPDDNPYCNAMYPVVPGTPVPETFYLSTCLDKDPDAKKESILAQTTFTVKHDVEVPESLLLWDFQTVYNDIGMGLMFYPVENGDDKEPKWLLPIKRIDSHRFLESGRYRCEQAGIYELVFDNTYSWWAKKDLTYKTIVLKPEEQTQELL